MKIIEKSIDIIIPYDKNPRLNDEAVKYVAESIKQFGFKVPIIIGQDNVIIAGHTRIKAAKKLGYKTVPCIVADDLTPEQIKAFRLADNKVAEKAEWDFDLLGDELDDILNIDMEAFGFDFEIEEEEPEAHEDDYEAELPEEPKSKIGDIYQLGRHRLMCGDSTSVEDVEKLMGGNNPHLIYTDPPYGMNAVSKSGVLSKSYDSDILNDDNNTCAIDCFNMSMNIFKDVKAIWWGGIIILNVCQAASAGLYGIRTMVQATKLIVN